MELLWNVAAKYNELDFAIARKTLNASEYTQKIREINNKIDMLVRVLDTFDIDFSSAEIINLVHKCSTKTMIAIRTCDIVDEQTLRIRFIHTFRKNLCFPGDDDKTIATVFCDILENVVQRCEMMYITIP
jgi:hypothetical protein